MAEILENPNGRKTIRLSVDDVINIVREYQNITGNTRKYSEIREKLEQTDFYLPEDK